MLNLLTVHEDVVEEIALDGLDGATLPTLWVNRYPDYPHPYHPCSRQVSDGSSDGETRDKIEVSLYYFLQSRMQRRYELEQGGCELDDQLKEFMWKKVSHSSNRKESNLDSIGDTIKRASCHQCLLTLKVFRPP